MRILSFGYDTDLLLPEGPENEARRRQAQYCDWLGQERTLVVMARKSPGAERGRIQGPLRVIDACSPSRWTALWKACRTGFEEARRLVPDAVEYQDPQLAGLAAWWMARRLGKPLVGGVFTDFLNNPAWYGRSPARRLFNRVGRMVLKRTRLARCDSRETAESLRAQGFPVRYVPFFIPRLEALDPGQEGMAGRRARWKDAFVVLCAARLSPEKNVAMLLRAFAALPARSRLTVLGRGPLEAPLKALARELGVAARVEWPGFVGFEEFARRFREAQAFALPSDFEASARVLVQAQAARLPTVTTATSGSARLVRDGETGFVTPVGDAAAFSRALAALATDAALYDRFSSADRGEILAAYGADGVKSALRDFYREAVPPASSEMEARR